MSTENCDLAIIGCGSTGLSAAIGAYSKDPDIKIKLFGIPFDSNTAKKGELETLPGINKIVGVDFIQQIVEQVQSFNLEFTHDKIIVDSKERTAQEEIISDLRESFPILDITNEMVNLVNKTDTGFEIITESQSFSTKAIIVSSGIPELKGTITGEDTFLHKGVSHCAVCDGALFRGRKAVIIGNGNITARGALFLKKFCRKITVLSPTETLDCDKRFLKKISSSENIKMKYNIEIESLEIFGQEVVQGVKYFEGGEEKQLSTDVVFIELKDKPNLSYLHELNLEITADGRIITNESNATNIAGLFAAGTVRGELDYVPVLIGDGYKTGVSAVEYLERAS